MRALEKKYFKKGQRFQARSVHDGIYESLRGWKLSMPGSEKLIPIPRQIKRGGGNLTGLEPGSAILRAK